MINRCEGFAIGSVRRGPSCLHCAKCEENRENLRYVILIQILGGSSIHAGVESLQTFSVRRASCFSSSESKATLRQRMK
jgi:hypothetical protein